MKVSLLQVASPDDESPEKRRDRVSELITSAKGSDLIVLPELWAPGYFAFSSYTERSESLDGLTVRLAQGWARELGAYVHIGSIVERGISGVLYNTAVLIDPSGAVAHTYRKVHVFGYQSLEAQLLSAGASVAVQEFPILGAVSASTCYDLRFPQLWERLSEAGASTVVVPAAWPMSRLDHWRVFTSARAIENQLWLISCNGCGTQSGTVLAGHSRIVSPWGEVVLEAGDDEGVFACEIDLDEVARVRAEFPVLRDRVTDIAIVGVSSSAQPRPYPSSSNQIGVGSG